MGCTSTAPETHRAPATPFRMAVDRVFTVQGRGTVVTGSVLCGRVQNGDTLEVFPGGHGCRVRDLQAHGAALVSIASDTDLRIPPAIVTEHDEIFWSSTPYTTTLSASTLEHTAGRGRALYLTTLRLRI